MKKILVSTDFSVPAELALARAARLAGEHGACLTLLHVVERQRSSAKELPILGPVIGQDMQNMPHVQEGLRASATQLVQLGDYQEVRIRHFHQTLDRYLADGG